MKELKDFIKASGYDVSIMAKIAGKDALDNFQEILTVSDAIIVARYIMYRFTEW